MNTIPEVDDYIAEKCETFAKPILKSLRQIYLSEGLIEEIKWGAPCYSHHGLLCSLGAFKKHVASWFFKGVLLSDPEGMLRKAQKNTKGLRSLYYEAGDAIDELQVRQFVKEAMILNEQGIEVPREKAPQLVAPDYFMEHLSKSNKAMATYEKLAPSHRKEYILWVTEAKKEDTRERRMAKMIALLNAGKGLNDKYRK